MGKMKVALTPQQLNLKKCVDTKAIFLTIFWIRPCKVYWILDSLQFVPDLLGV